MSWHFVVSGNGLQNKNCSMISPLQTNLPNARGWAYLVSWLTQMYVKKSISLLSAIDSASWDISCMRQLIVLSDCFLIFIRKSCNFGLLFSLACLISYKPFKIFSWFFAQMWVLYMKVSFQLTWNHSLVFQFLTTDNTIRTLLLLSRWNESEGQIVFIILSHETDTNCTMLMLPTLVPATLDSLP
jgi:hypothetical protein